MAAKEEEQLVRRILADLTELVRAEHHVLADSFTALVEIDALFARAAFAQRYHCTQPVLDDEEMLRTILPALTADAALYRRLADLG